MHIYRASGMAAALAAMGAVALASPSSEGYSHDGRPDLAKPTRPKRRGTFKQKARQQIRANAKKKARR